MHFRKCITNYHITCLCYILCYFGIEVNRFVSQAALFFSRAQKVAFCRATRTNTRNVRKIQRTKQTTERKMAHTPKKKKQQLKIGMQHKFMGCMDKRHVSSVQPISTRAFSGHRFPPRVKKNSDRQTHSISILCKSILSACAETAKMKSYRRQVPLIDRRIVCLYHGFGFCLQEYKP